MLLIGLLFFLSFSVGLGRADGFPHGQTTASSSSGDALFIRVDEFEERVRAGLGFIVGFCDFALTFGGFLLGRFDRVPFAVVDVEAFDEREDAYGALREGELEHF